MTRPARVALLAVAIAAVAVAWGLLDVRQRARLDRGAKYHRTDFTVYTAASEALYRGDDPYQAKSPRGWRYVYPPLLAISIAPLTRLPVPDAAFVWYLLNVGVLVVAGVAMARSIGPGGVRATAIALVLAAPFLVQTFQRGQVTILLLALQTTAVLALVRGRDVLAGFLLAVGVALRLTPLLPAGMVGIACLRALLRGDGVRVLRFPAGLALGLVLTFAVIPAVALGPARALDVTKRWLEVGREVYAAAPGEAASLERDYEVDENSFKNQSVRQVSRTWTWLIRMVAGLDAIDPVPGSAEDLARHAHQRDVDATADRLAWIAALVVTVVAIALAWSRLRDRHSAAFRRTMAIGIAMSLLVTRYTWPVHFVVVAPLLAEAIAGRGRRRWTAVAVFAAATALFYASHGPDLRMIAGFGVLLAGLLGAVILMAAADREPSGGQPLAIGDEMPLPSLGGAT